MQAASNRSKYRFISSLFLFLVQFTLISLQVKIKAKDGCVYAFPSHQWLASNVGDGKISRELVGKSHCANTDSPPEGKSSFSHEQVIVNENSYVFKIPEL